MQTVLTCRSCSCSREMSPDSSKHRIISCSRSFWRNLLTAAVGIFSRHKPTCDNGNNDETAKTEILWFSSSRRQFQIPRVPFRVGTATIAPSSVVRDLGIYLDSSLSMTTHISKTVSNCFSTMRLIRSVHRSVSNAALLSVVTALVLSRISRPAKMKFYIIDGIVC